VPGHDGVAGSLAGEAGGVRRGNALFRSPLSLWICLSSAKNRVLRLSTGRNSGRSADPSNLDLRVSRYGEILNRATTATLQAALKPGSSDRTPFRRGGGPWRRITRGPRQCCAAHGVAVKWVILHPLLIPISAQFFSTPQQLELRSRAPSPWRPWIEGRDRLRHNLPEGAIWPWRGPGRGRACLVAGGTECGGGIVNLAAGKDGSGLAVRTAIWFESNDRARARQ
jgi:hypothetical protein